MASCSTEESNISEEQNLLHSSTAEGIDQRALASYDQHSNGIYKGAIVANELNFHGKLWVNLGNDSTYSAFIETDSGEKLVFSLLQQRTMDTGVYTFVGDRGSLTVDVSDYSNPTVTEVLIDQTIGSAKVQKETSNSKLMVYLGTFDEDFVAGFSGTWDIVVDAETGWITEVIIATDAGQMNSDLQENFELGYMGCYTGDGDAPLPPFFFSDLDPAVNEYELYSVGQLWTLPNGMTIIYDFGFSKNILDSAGYVYEDNGAFYPDITGQFLFSEPLDPGCYILDANGYYLLINAAGDTFIGGGRINLDTSGLVPVVPSVNGLTTNNNYQQAPESAYNGLTPIF
ncbi:hypothetical protein MG296_08670 [Flavobacteriaceae bacterium TK19130]|nr:hypothetical protein [Thermobacterium salinum]